MIMSTLIFNGQRLELRGRWSAVCLLQSLMYLIGALYNLSLYVSFLKSHYNDITFSGPGFPGRLPWFLGRRASIPCR